MPLVQVSMNRGRSREYRKAIADGIYEAMRETFNVPEADRFIVFNQHDQDEFDYSRDYLDIQRSNDIVIIQITCNKSRTVEMKKAFYKSICEKLVRKPRLRREDIFINLLEVDKENWSFGNGEAQYA